MVTHYVGSPSNRVYSDEEEWQLLYRTLTPHICGKQNMLSTIWLLDVTCKQCLKAITKEDNISY